MTPTFLFICAAIAFIALCCILVFCAMQMPRAAIVSIIIYLLSGGLSIITMFVLVAQFLVSLK